MVLTRRRMLSTTLVGLTAAHGMACAQSYPARPVKLVVGAAPGGPSDFLARLMGEALATSLGQPFFVENKPGASGTFATEAVARSAPDGHTLLLGGPGSTVVAPHVFARLKYDPAKDLVPVSVIGAGAFVLAVNAALPVRTAQEFMALARSKPDKLDYGSGGKGSSGHLAGELLGDMLGVNLPHVPYKGDGPAFNDLLSGQIQFMLTAPNVALPHAKSGRLRILAVTSRERLTALPDVPTLIEAGLPEFEYLGWIIAFAPSGTPRTVIDTLQKAWSQVRDQPGPVRTKLDELGMLPPTRLGRPAALQAFMQDEATRMAALVKKAGITPE